MCARGWRGRRCGCRRLGGLAVSSVCVYVAGLYGITGETVLCCGAASKTHPTPWRSALRSKAHA